jgi:Domain of unknown function (DUF4349)
VTIRQICAVVFATAALAGCASGAGSAMGGAPVAVPRSLSGQAQPASADTTQRVNGDTPATQGSSLAQPAAIIVGTPPSADIERSVNAAYTVPARTFLTSFEGVIGRAVALGGYVVSSATQPDSTGRIVSGAVTLKVPAAKIADFLNGMPSSFVASAINFSSVDHTAQFVDVTARLASARAHLAALDALLAKATSIGDITSLEQQIETVQVEIDTEQGQLNVLAASVELATASVAMSERGVSVAPATPPNPVSNGVGSGWDNAVRVSGAVLEGVVSALPLLVLAAIGLLVWRRPSRMPLGRRRSASPE